ncbi:MAG: ferritin-like domain-containing protein [Acidobacteriota bacterium]|nr:ferritin-like domain-containing protein [Acidobacteriota bacterium]
MKHLINDVKRAANRRSFIKKALAATGTVGVGAGILTSGSTVFGQDTDEGGGALSKGDAAILRFLAAAEIIESDLWQQYNELGGVQDSELPGLGGGRGGSAPYIAALAVLDADMSQYIHDNTEDEISHFRFLNAYLDAKRAEPVNLDNFRTLPSSRATGARQIGRLTNLMQLTVDTSWWTRYRSRTHNPDLDPTFKFPQAVPSLSVGRHPAIPRSDSDLAPKNHIQAIANTAGFHFAFIEQGGTSLYPSLAQRVTNVEVLRILLSIGPTETAHFQTWHDKAGNAPAITDPNNSALVFPDLNSPPFGGEDFQTNLIMPEPVPFLSRKFPVCSIIRPTETKGAAMGAVRALTEDGLFIGQSPAFFELLQDLAEAADSASRER